MNRRKFIATATTASVAAALTPFHAFAAGTGPMPTARKLPRWRGFNLTQKVSARRGGNPPFSESDFALLEEWGFDFARLPLSYLCWATADEPTKLREPELEHLEDAVELGRKHGVHVNLN